MKPFLFVSTLLLPFLAVNSAFADWPNHPKFGFPVYTNLPAGRQMTGQWAPAGTPARTPEEQQKLFKVPPGFEVRLFAADPDIANPVAMTWDERGRLWVLELYEYPSGAPAGAKGRDRVKVLEDVDGDGRADKVTVFVDGLNLATGLALGRGGVYVGQAPHLYFFEDTNGDGVSDKQTIVLTGFGLEDRHELLNGFQWGPDGQLYMTHGVFTHSKVVNPAASEAEKKPVELTAGLARFDPGTRRFEVFAEGTSNPWGVDFDATGNAFVSACVIDHLFHLTPGGIYARQAGQPPFPYAYELLPSIVTHKHHMAAYSGVCVYQGDQWPAKWAGEVFMGNIHQHALNWDHLEPNGSSFKAVDRGDFLTTSDEWFMPVSTQVGPDGALWVMDWYDRYPCYQNANADPGGVDRERGRIWRVVWTGDQPGKPVASRPAGLDLGRASGEELVKALSHSNVWMRRMAQRLLSERKDPATQEALVSLMVRSQPNVGARLAALWTLHGAGLLDEEMLDLASFSTEPAMRAWAVRLTGERRAASEGAVGRVGKATKDPHPTVRLAAATAVRQYMSGTLTVDTPAPKNLDRVPAPQLVVSLVEGSRDAKDPLIPFMTWMAVEPLLMADPAGALDWFSHTGMTNLPLSAQLLNKSMRRFCDRRDPKWLSRAVEFIHKAPLAQTPVLVAALDGLIEGQRGKALVPATSPEEFLKRLRESGQEELASRARQLGALWGDSEALRASLQKLIDGGGTVEERLAIIRSVRQSKSEDTRGALYAVIGAGTAPAIRSEAIRALGESGDEATGERLLQMWKAMDPGSRRVAAELMAGRSRWAMLLLGAVREGKVDAGEIPLTVVRNLAESRSESLRAEARRVFGRVNATPAEKMAILREKRAKVVDGPVNLEAGRDVARKACLVCHKFFGEGAEVGPDLTGVGRSSLDALLRNVIHPNEIIGQGYENVEVEARDGRTVSGRLMENSEARVRVRGAGGQDEVLARADVKAVRVSENSVMPEGLEQMPEGDFRNLIWYLLAPPQEGKPLTEQRKRELIQAGVESAGGR